LIIVVYALLMKTQNRPSKAPNLRAPISQPAGSPPPAVVASDRVLLDLTTAAPERGLQPPAPPPMRSIPAKPRIYLTLRLPIGSEVGMYSVKLASKRGTQWSSAARASIEDGEPVLNLRGDFSHLPGGTYELVVVSKAEHLRQPVVIAPPPGELR